MDCFLYDNGLRHERVKQPLSNDMTLKWSLGLDIRAIAHAHASTRVTGLIRVKNSTHYF